MLHNLNNPKMQLSSRKSDLKEAILKKFISQDRISQAADVVLSLFFPRRCPVCQDIVWPTGERICPGCRDKIAFIREPVCKKCGKEISNWETEYCYDCARHPRSFYEGISLMRYDRVGQATMQGFKYHGRQEYGAYYIEEILSKYGEKIRSWHADAVIPVPAHKSRERKRGYNQAEILARELSKRTGIPELKNVLLRTKKTTAQKNLGGRERFYNLQQAMTVKNRPEWAKTVILIDDIYTTGSTAEACTRVLLSSGVKRVYLITVCIGSNR